MKQVGVYPSEDVWVDDFAEWAMDHFHIYFVEGLKAASNSQRGVWVEYQWKGAKGIYVERNVASLENLIYEWLRANQLVLSTHHVREALARLRTRVHKEVQEFDRYDPNDPSINCLSGIYYPLTGELLPHSPNYLTLNQVPCVFKARPSQNADLKERMKEDFNTLVKLESQMPCWMSMREHYPKQMNYIERYAQMVLYRDIKHKMGLYVVGGSNTGKGTVGHVLGKMFATVASYQPMSELNEKWGLMPLIGKLVNFDFDSGMGYLSKLGLGRLKTIIGDPGKPYSTPIIYAGARDVVFSPFFFTFSNQLQKLPANVDRKAWGKRALCLIMNKTFQDDFTFEEDILAEVDTLFTYLCLKPYHPIAREEFGSFAEFVSRNLKIWDVWSDPVRKILIECFERSFEVSDIYMKEDIERVLLEIMDDREIEPAKGYSNAIKKTMKRMGVASRNRKVGGIAQTVYVGVRPKYIPPTVPMIYPIEFHNINKEHGVPFEDLLASRKKKLDDIAQSKDEDLAILEAELEIEMDEIEEEPVLKNTMKSFYPTERILTYSGNKDDPIFKQILFLSQTHSNYELDMDDIWEPLSASNSISDKSEIRNYVQTMIKSDLLEKNNKTNRWRYVGKI